MTTPTETIRRTRSVEALVFDVVLVAFVGLIVYTALGINPRAASVPLIIGIPTLIGLVVVLASDLRGRVVPTGGDHVPVEAASLRTSSVAGTLELAEEELTADAELPSDRQSRRRQAILAAWVVGFVALAAATNFRIAAPIALIAILLITTRRIVPTLAITGVAAVFLYLIFDVFLDVAF